MNAEATPIQFNLYVIWKPSVVHWTGHRRSVMDDNVFLSDILYIIYHNKIPFLSFFSFLFFFILFCFVLLLLLLLLIFWIPFKEYDEFHIALWLFHFIAIYSVGGFNSIKERKLNFWFIHGEVISMRRELPETNQEWISWQKLGELRNDLYKIFFRYQLSCSSKSTYFTVDLLNCFWLHIKTAS